MRRTSRPRGGARWVMALGALALLAGGCSGPPTHPAPADLAASQILRYGMPTAGSGDIATLDPDIVSDTNSEGVMSLIYDGLVTLDPHMQVEDWGADRVNVSANGLTYTFHIRSGQRFANGTPVTAASYAYSLDRTLNPCLASPVSYYLFTIKDAQTFAFETCHDGVLSPSQGQAGTVLATVLGDGIIVIDANTLVITLAQPAGYFLTTLTYPVDAALDPTVIGADPTNEAWTDALNHGPSGQGTSGMFRVARWDHQQGVVILKRNLNWWGLNVGRTPYLTEIDLSLLRDADQAYSGFEHGQYDIGFPTTATLAAARGQPDFHAVPAFTVRPLTMDWTKAPYNNQDAREALCLAVNRDALNQQIYAGQFLPTWHIVPQGMRGYNAQLTGPDGVTSTQGDPAAARAHWQTYLQSLHGAKPPALTYQYEGGSTGAYNLAQALVAQWKSVLGITVTPQAWQFVDWLGAVNPVFPPIIVTVSRWQADYPDPQDVLSQVLEVGATNNIWGVNVPDADKLAARADRTSDPTQRSLLYNQAEQLYVNAVAWCPLFQETNSYLLRSLVHGWQMDGRGLTPDDTWLATYLTTH